MLIATLLSSAGLAILVLTVLCKLGHQYVWHTGKIIRKRFPNGMMAWGFGGDMTLPLVYKEMFEDRAYFINGVSLSPPPPGALDKSGVPLIVDVGTNVGFFALSVARQLDEYDIACFEPVPMLAEIAGRNLESANKDGAKSRQRIVVNRMGLGSKDASIEFEFNSNFSAGAAMDQQGVKDAAKDTRLLSWIRAAVHDSQFFFGFGGWFINPLRALLGVPVIGVIAMLTIVPIVYLPLIVRIFTSPNTKTQVKADVRRLSDMLKKHEGMENSDRPIAMLKIDVEGAEWDVLMGIDDATWARVQQCVIETHDIDGRVEKAMRLLKAKGFKHVVKGVEELETHLLLGLETIFATRNVPAKKACT